MGESSMICKEYGHCNYVEMDGYMCDTQNIKKHLE